MELRTVLERFDDRPAYKVFTCDTCNAVDWIAMQ
jgi:hypothetical protein